jgi:Bacterial extracellular solute-binding proteins, family 5 Middle
MRRVFHSTRRLALALLCALIACTGGSTDAPGPADITGGGSSTGIRRGGGVTFGIIGEPSTWDPYARKASEATYAVVRPLFPSLYSFMPDGSVRPYLARSATPVRSGVRVTIEKAHWSDGKPITARDVVASARRARVPSGFARFRSARAVGARRVLFRASFGDWKRALATASFVLPQGRVSRGDAVSGGPFVLERVTPGLEAVYARNERWWGDKQPFLERVIVQFIQDLDVMLALLADDRLDAAAPPSSVNLDERLEALDLEHEEALGWETVYLDLEGADLDESGRSALARAVDRRGLEHGFVRDMGRTVDTLYPGPGKDGRAGKWPTSPLAPGDASDQRVQIAVAVGDELTELVQRALRLQLEDAGFEIELVATDASTFYGGWKLTDPMDVAVRRAWGAPGLRDNGPAFRNIRAIPLFGVESVVAWQKDIRGIAPNPTLEGPLWSMHAWSRAGDS